MKSVIICVDDEKIVLDSLKFPLNKEFSSELDIEFAESGEEALEIIEELFHKANEIIESNLEVTDSIMTRDEINAIMPPDRTNMDLLPISVKKLRVVKIGDNLDLCPCAGTHVRALGEIGEMKFLGRKNKGKGTTRVSYTLEGCES